MDSTTIKGFQILERLAASDVPLGVTELAKETGFSKSNVQRILATLCTIGYAEKDLSSNRFFATLKMWQLGIHILLRNRILRVAKPALKSLYAATGETVVLCVPEGDDIVYLEKMESEKPIRLSCAIGTRLPVITTATGRAIAAFWSDGVQQSLFEAQGAQIKELPFDLQDRFTTIRKQGYDTSVGGYRQGVNSVAVPLRDADGSVVASIAISGPEERLTTEVMKEHSHLLLDTASNISSSLGYLGAAA